MSLWLTVCSPCSQIRNEGTLEQRVFSLQARRALLQSLDLIPAGCTYEAACAAVEAALKDGTIPARPTASRKGSGRETLQPSSGRQPVRPYCNTADSQDGRARKRRRTAPPAGNHTAAAYLECAQTSNQHARPTRIRAPMASLHVCYVTLGRAVKHSRPSRQAYSTTESLHATRSWSQLDKPRGKRRGGARRRWGGMGPTAHPDSPQKVSGGAAPARSFGG
jgi:hypothetical protein